MSEKRLAVRDCPNCDIEWDGALDTIRTAVVYFCAMHAAAVHLHNALLAILAVMEPAPPNSGATGYVFIPKSVLQEARAALKKARGE